MQVHDATFAPDISIVIKETLPTLEKAVRDGKARYIGIADYDIDLMQEIVEESDVKISTILSYAKSTLFDNRLQNYTSYFKVMINTDNVYFYQYVLLLSFLGDEKAVELMASDRSAHKNT